MHLTDAKAWKDVAQHFAAKSATPGHSVVVYASGEEEAKEMQTMMMQKDDRFTEAGKQSETDKCFYTCALNYARMDEKEKQNAVKPLQRNEARVIIGTERLGRSVTLPSLNTVIDPGLVKRRQCLGSLTRLHMVRDSPAGRKQRAGRAGRTEPGTVYQFHYLPGEHREGVAGAILTSQDSADWLLLAILMAELVGTSLTDSILTNDTQVRLLGVSPRESVEVLSHFNLVKMKSEEEKLCVTVVGRLVASLPVPLRVAMMIVISMFQDISAWDTAVNVAMELADFDEEQSRALWNASHLRKLADVRLPAEEEKDKGRSKGKRAMSLHGKLKSKKAFCVDAVHVLKNKVSAATHITQLLFEAERCMGSQGLMHADDIVKRALWVAYSDQIGTYSAVLQCFVMTDGTVLEPCEKQTATSGDVVLSIAARANHNGKDGFTSMWQAFQPMGKLDIALTSSVRVRSNDQLSLVLTDSWVAVRTGHYLWWARSQLAAAIRKKQGSTPWILCKGGMTSAELLGHLFKCRQVIGKNRLETILLCYNWNDTASGRRSEEEVHNVIRCVELANQMAQRVMWLVLDPGIFPKYKKNSSCKKGFNNLVRTLDYHGCNKIDVSDVLRNATFADGVHVDESSSGHLWDAFGKVAMEFSNQ